MQLGHASAAAPRIAAIVPCYGVRRHIDALLRVLLSVVDHVYVVDDACPERTREHVRTSYDESAVTVVIHAQNQGVGGAVISGYRPVLAFAEAPCSRIGQCQY